MNTFTTEYFSQISNKAIAKFNYPTEAPGLYKPIRYALESGGKRIRPTLVLATYSALSGRPAEEAVNQALAIEMFHNFTLLHDDVMDHADVRRGRPSVHCAFGESSAILSGDTMLTMAQQLLVRCKNEVLRPLVEAFDAIAMGVYQGQQLDMEFEDRDDVSVQEYMRMIELKTSVLLAGASEIGAILAGADKETRTALYEYGLNLGIAFQLRDDWLDTFGDPSVFGKAIGGDIINGKKTWLLIKAMELSDGEIESILAEDLENEERIEQVSRLYRQYKLGDECEQLAMQYSERALKALKRIHIPEEAYTYFENLAIKASTRHK